MLTKNYEPTEPGIFEIDFETYKRIKAVNIHGLVHMRKSPLHYITALKSPDDKPTPDMIMGTAFELALQFPDEFKSLVVEDLPMNHNKNDYKAWRGAQDLAGRIVLPTRKITAVWSMVRKVRQKKAAMDLLESGVPQRVLIWRHPEHGFWCKGRTDWITGGGIVVDLKKTRDASFSGFGHQAGQLKYTWQACWYLVGLSIITGRQHDCFCWIAWEDEPPYEGCVYRASERDLDSAWAEIEMACDLLDACTKADEWPGYPDELCDLSVSRYQSQPPRELADHYNSLSDEALFKEVA